MAEIILVTRARLSFPHIAEPQVQKDNVTGKTRSTYNCDLILTPDNPAYKEFMQRFAELATAKWKESAQAAMGQINANRKQRCYGAGEEKVDSKTFQVRGGYAGHVFISASKQAERGMPQIIDDSGKQVDPANTMACQMIARKMYGGCYVNAAIKPWLQQNETGIGIRCDLVALQFAADGEAFGEGAVDAAPLFGAVASAPAAVMPGVTMPAAPFPSFLGQG